MIASFQDGDTEKIFHGIRVKRFQQIERAAVRKLFQLHAAKSLEDLKSPGNSLEALRRNRKGQHSVRINDRYRICFVWKEGDAYDVEIVNYH